MATRCPETVTKGPLYARGPFELNNPTRGEAIAQLDGLPYCKGLAEHQ
jgi:hypothetical protein